ncbi:TetR/AcrR family transcriptional regulator [Jannaschia marina]|uniref:TetR/AcrR family transcriptional regulator n=1 Tax=Jannaschia marina TaxID=2741674 RepID=UPI0015CD9B99|nr:TetR/AcrR family transcriptional regulator [Jannaschia marina]
MPDPDREDRIAAAAYTLLSEKGYAGASMLSIAKAARASNETLYKWYGDKCGLFTALARRNARAIREDLDAALAGDGSAPETLARVAPRLLAMLLDDPAILLNRAAAGDATGALGQAIAEGGRADIAPRIGGLVARALRDAGSDMPPDRATTLFLDLLIGDRQIRRVIGTLPRPTRAETEARAATALTDFARLTGIAV